MDMKISRTKRRCRIRTCRKTFISVNGHPTCQRCMVEFARTFWATMGIKDWKPTVR